MGIWQMLYKRELLSLFPKSVISAFIFINFQLLYFSSFLNWMAIPFILNLPYLIVKFFKAVDFPLAVILQVLI